MKMVGEETVEQRIKLGSTHKDLFHFLVCVIPLHH